MTAGHVRLLRVGEVHHRPAALLRDRDRRPPRRLVVDVPIPGRLVDGVEREDRVRPVFLEQRLDLRGIVLRLREVLVAVAQEDDALVADDLRGLAEFLRRLEFLRCNLFFPDLAEFIPGEGDRSLQAQDFRLSL